MRIKNISIQNYRSIESDTVTFDPLTALVGRNGAGKSTILSAIAHFYDLSAQATEYDYFNRETTREIRIAVTFNTLSPEELTEFGSYVIGGELRVTKVITSGGAFYRGSKPQIPEFAELRALAFTPARVRLRELAQLERFSGLEGTVRSQEALTTLLDNYEAAHPELMLRIESAGQFLGPTNVGGGKLDKFTRFVRIPAVRDAAGEMDRRGAILQLLDILILRSVAARPEVKALNEEIEKRVREIYSKGNLSELGRLAESVTAILTRYAPGASLELDFDSIQAPKIPQPVPLAALVEDDFRCPVHYTGHGLQRALIFALLEQLAVTQASANSRVEATSGDGEGEAGNIQATAETPPCLILAIEEPELYLHPPRSRFLARTLLGLTQQSESATTQVCYTTHSPFYAGLDRFDQIRIARKAVSTSPPTRRTSYSEYSLANAARDLQVVTGREMEAFTPDTFFVRAAPIMTSIVNEGFFADVVVVVEGLCDAAALGAAQDVLGLRWDEKGIVVVPALGKRSIDRPVVVFRGFKIPTFFVFDGDADCAAGSRAETADNNRLLLRLAGTAEVDFPVTQVNRDWAVFENDLEHELLREDETYYHAERGRLASEYGFGKPSQAAKNAEIVALFVRRAHLAGKLPRVIENLVTAITNLANPAQPNLQVEELPAVPA